MNRAYLSRLLQRGMDEDSMEDKPKPGRPRRVVGEVKERLLEEAKQAGFNFTTRGMANKLGIPKTTLNDAFQQEWRMVRQSTRPTLTPHQQQLRLDFANAHMEETWSAWVDLDEKWFHTVELGSHLRVPIGVEAPVKKVQSKSNIPKLMFLVAVAKPNKQHNFDGKIGIWPVMENYEAKRDSKNHKAGDVYLKPCSVTSELFERYVREKVFPAIRRKLRWATVVTLQYDGARPHTGHSVPARLSKQRQDSSPKIEMVQQPPQSPDLNCNDLGFFHSLAVKVDRAQVHAGANDIEQLMSSVKAEWRQYDQDTLTRVWKLKSRVLQLIKEHEGKNDFKIGHREE